MAKKQKLHVTLGIDLGGTKVEVGLVNSQGKVISSAKQAVHLSPEGPKALVRQISDMAQEQLLFARDRNLSVQNQIGIASAGPLDPSCGTLIDPTNFSAGSPLWKKVPLAQYLSKALHRPVLMENDAAAAALAEQWVGIGKGNRGSKNFVVLTLGTGLGTAIIANGQLVRAGRGLHTEAGHIIIGANDSTARCGCGNLGCAEAYLSGKHFEQRARALWKLSGTAIEMAEQARSRNPAAITAFQDYAQWLAVACHSMAVTFAPEKIVLSGSFALVHECFLPEAEKILSQLMKRRREGIDLLPRLVVSKLRNQSGLIGAAYLATQSKNRKKAKQKS